MFDIQIFGVSAVGAIMGIIDLMKDAGFPKKYVPLVAIGLGVLVGVFLVDPKNLSQGLIDGLSLGLSAIGVHSGVKNVREGLLEMILRFKAAMKAKEQAKAQQQAQQK